ncbi:MAG TPA: Flp pilus assembly complex ATPase component TadA [Firmicutes bacterium]|nr:Flp pilus assembly complex ATPase component TadA [Bacillota bacterium]
MESALAGHLVLATLHTKGAAEAITRLGDMGIWPYWPGLWATGEATG